MFLLISQDISMFKKKKKNVPVSRIIGVSYSRVILESS